MTRLLSPRIQVEGADGRPLAGAKLYTYVSGTNTPKPTYTDVALSVAHTNPVIADAAGRFPAIFLTTGDYKTELRDANEVVIATDDPVEGAPTVVSLATADNVDPVIYNSRFGVWQLGTSIAISASTSTASAIYGPDGWAMETNANQACTLSRQTGITADSLFCMRVQRNSGQTGTAALIPQQWIETDLIAQLIGKRVTFSADLRAGTNFSGTLQMVVYAGTGTQGRRPVGGTYTAETTPILSGALGVTTSTQRFTFTSGAEIPAGTTQMCVAFRWTPSGTAGANDYFEVGRVVLAPAPGIDPPVTSQTYEVMRCERYIEAMSAYCRYDGSSSGSFTLGVSVPYRTAKLTTATFTTVTDASTNVSGLSFAHTGAGVNVEGTGATGGPLTRFISVAFRAHCFV